MQHRRLGHSGLPVSALSLGAWVTYQNQVASGSVVGLLAAAFGAGINFFDDAEACALGAAKRSWARPSSSGAGRG